MFRFLIILGLILANGSLHGASDDSKVRLRAYFKNLDLPYTVPRGCNADTPCSVSADFNGDGQPDQAALYEYSGNKSRRQRWNLDLIIVYSNDDASGLSHAIFTHVGQTDSESQTLASLAVQEIGPLKIPAGEMMLERPGINIIAGKNSDPSQFPTYYWRGQGFYSIDKEDD